MNDIIESESHENPLDVKNNVAGRWMDKRSVKALDLELKGDAMDGAKNFGDNLSLLRKKGVKISHEFLIKMKFPHAMAREEVLEIVEGMPKPRNGSIKARIYLEHSNDSMPKPHLKSTE